MTFIGLLLVLLLSIVVAGIPLFIVAFSYISSFKNPVSKTYFNEKFEEATNFFGIKSNELIVATNPMIKMSSAIPNSLINTKAISNFIGVSSVNRSVYENAIMTGKHMIIIPEGWVDIAVHELSHISGTRIKNRLYVLIYKTCFNWEIGRNGMVILNIMAGIAGMASVQAPGLTPVFITAIACLTLLRIPRIIEETIALIRSIIALVAIKEFSAKTISRALNGYLIHVFDVALWSITFCVAIVSTKLIV